eukprot:1194102-Pleurochrysis_carterae.AAC.2
MLSQSVRLGSRFPLKATQSVAIQKSAVVMHCPKAASTRVDRGAKVGGRRSRARTTGCARPRRSPASVFRQGCRDSTWSRTSSRPRAAPSS